MLCIYSKIMEAVENTTPKTTYKKKYYTEFAKNHNTKEVSTCEICGGKISYYTKFNHLKSKKHQFALTSSSNNEKEKALEKLNIQLNKLQQKIDLLSKI